MTTAGSRAEEVHATVRQALRKQGRASSPGPEDNGARIVVDT
ncbi:hypothetical protein ACFXDH_12685 [Streptomyces sp. NPDC059467]